MRKQGRRISSFILVLAMILTMIPMAGAVAFADEPEAFDPTEIIYKPETFNEEHAADYVISAPAAALWTFTAHDDKYTIQNVGLNDSGNNNGKYLNFSNKNDYLKLRSSNFASTFKVNVVENKAYVYYDFTIEISKISYSNLNFLNSSLTLTNVSDEYEWQGPILGGGYVKTKTAAEQLEPFGYLFGSDGKLVSSDFSDGKYILVSGGKYLSYAEKSKYHSLGNYTEYWNEIESSSEGLVCYYPTTPEVNTKSGLVYNGQCQEIFSCGEGLVVDAVSGATDYIKGTTTVGAFKAGTYTIMVKPAEGCFWSDWTTDAKSVSVDIDQARAEISLILPESITFGESVPEAIITQSGFLAEDFEKLELSYGAFTALKSPRSIVDLTPGGIMPYYYKGITINYELLYDETDPVYDNYFVRFMLPKPVKVNPIALPEQFISEDTYPEYNGQLQKLIEWNEHVDLVTVSAIEDTHWVVSGDALYAREAGPYDVILAPENGYSWSDGSLDERFVEYFIRRAVASMFAVPAEDTAYYKGTVPEATISFAGVIGNDADLLDPVLKIYNDADPDTVLQPGDTVDLPMGSLVYELEDTTSAAFDNFFVNYVLYADPAYVPVIINEELVEEAKVVTGATISGAAVGTTTATIELVFVAAEKTGEEAASASALAKQTLEQYDENNVLRVVKMAVEVELCIKEDDRLTMIENAEVLGEPLDVYIPYEWESFKNYEVAHFNGSALDAPVKADKVTLSSGDKYLHFKANRFSPYVVLEAYQWYEVNVQPGSTYRVEFPAGNMVIENGTCLFNVWAQSEYRIKNVADLNGNAVQKISETEYKLQNVTTDACIKIETEKVESRTETVYVGGGSSSPKSYNLTLLIAGSGKCDFDKKYEAGEMVTFKPEPTGNFVLGKVKITTDKNGTEISYTEKDGVYTFIMPKEAVTVKVAFDMKPVVDVLEPYIDLDMNAWYIPSIRFCVENNYANGTSETTFEPESTLTRAEVITMLWKMAGKPYVNYYMQIPDVQSGDWYAEAVRWAASQKIVSDKTAFEPGEPAPRQVAATFLYRYIKSLGGGFTGLFLFNLEAKDKDLIADWAMEAVMYLNMKGIMTGDGGYLNPTATMTRAEMCALIKKFCDADIEKYQQLGEPVAIEPAIEPAEETPVEPQPETPDEPQQTTQLETSKYDQFTDLKRGEWYEQPVEYCLEKGYSNGISETLFAPENKISRAEVIAMLWKMAGKPYVNYAMQIPDVAEGSWYAEAVRWAASLKIVSDGTAFNPDSLAQRQEAACFLYRYIQSKGGGFKGLWMFNMDLADKNTIASWAIEPCMYLYVNNIMTGSEGKFNPEAIMTRAEMCALIYKYENQ